jgi:glycerol-3-phosphate cytidylyltransferase-like family protein
MDTRTKIVSDIGAIVSDKRVTLVTGYFDVLRAAHVEALERACRPDHTLLVAVRTLPGAILALQARAEMVAALRMVDYVVTGDDRELDSLVSSLNPAQIVRLEDEDRMRASELKQHVQRRQIC